MQYAITQPRGGKKQLANQTRGRGRTKGASAPAAGGSVPLLSRCKRFVIPAKSLPRLDHRSFPGLFGLKYICKKYPISPINSLGSSFIILLLAGSFTCHVRPTCPRIGASCSVAGSTNRSQRTESTTNPMQPDVRCSIGALHIST
jgi:hypothetical protein